MKFWPFKKKNQDVVNFSKEERESLDTEIKETRKKLSDLLKKKNQKTAKDVIEFVVTSIHKDRKGLILDRVLAVDKHTSYKKLKAEWNDSAKATTNGWFGEVKASGPKEKLVSVMHKISEHGGIIILDPMHKINIPPANKWWDAEWLVKKQAEKFADKKKKDDKKDEKKNDENKNTSDARKEFIEKNKDIIDNN